MNPEKAKQSSYVLWLIRDGHAQNWEQLCLHFGWDPGVDHTTGAGALKESLRKLEDAGLIQASTPYETCGEIRVTSLVSEIQQTLAISIRQLAEHEPGSSMWVSPIFGVPHGKAYSYDLFVLMPFERKFQPLYEDHIKTVAKELAMSVARADDFFTTQAIIGEVWSAIAQSKIVIADCTDRNPNVFYEIGIAHAIGKPVILITQNVEDIPFDLRHRRYIKYEYTPRGVKEFERRLKTTLLDW